METKPQHGGNRPGAGRKTKAESAGLDGVLTECWTRAERKACVRRLAEKAALGEMEAIKLLFAYTFGKPKEQVDVKSAGRIEVVYANDWRSA